MACTTSTPGSQKLGVMGHSAVQYTTPACCSRHLCNGPCVLFCLQDSQQLEGLSVKLSADLAKQQHNAAAALLDIQFLQVEQQELLQSHAAHLQAAASFPTAQVTQALAVSWCFGSACRQEAIDACKHTLLPYTAGALASATFKYDTSTLLLMVSDDGTLHGTQACRQQPCCGVPCSGTQLSIKVTPQRFEVAVRL